MQTPEQLSDRQARLIENQQYRQSLTVRFPVPEMQALLQTPQELGKFYHALLSGNPYPANFQPVAQAIFGTDAIELDLDPSKSQNPQTARTTIEQQYRFAYGAEPLIEEQSIKSIRPSYGRFAPFYLAQFRAYIPTHPQIHTTLLVGAITEDSPIEAQVTLDRAFQTPQTRIQRRTARKSLSVDVIDLWASTEMRQALRQKSINFIEGNFLTASSLKSRSYDSVQTNLLLQDLRNSQDTLTQDTQTQEQLLEQVAVVLKKGGILLMVESSSNPTFAETIQQKLEGADFTDIQIMFSAFYLTRRSVDRFINERSLPTQTFSGQGTTPAQYGLYGIRAIKR